MIKVAREVENLLAIFSHFNLQVMFVKQNLPVKKHIVSTFLQIFGTQSQKTVNKMLTSAKTFEYKTIQMQVAKPEANAGEKPGVILLFLSNLADSVAAMIVTFFAGE